MPERSHGCEERVGDHTALNRPAHELRPACDCPHIDANDERCGHRFSLGRIDQAFSVCFGAFHACPIYHRINGELHEQVKCDRHCPAVAAVPDGAAVCASAANRAVAVVTVSARAGSQRLRATGT